MFIILTYYECGTFKESFELFVMHYNARQTSRLIEALFTH